MSYLPPKCGLVKRSTLKLPPVVDPEKERRRREWRSDIDSLAIRLGALFPKAFPPNLRRYAPIAPLKVGIRRDIRAACANCPAAILGIVLSRYTRSAGYRRLLVAGATRIDLDGNPAGIVTEEQAARQEASHAAA